MDGEGPRELERLADRNWRWWELYCGGLTQTEIARREGVHQSTVSDAIQKVRASLPELEVRQEVQRSLAMLQRLRAGAMDLVEAAAAPVTVGKDGDLLYDPELKGPDGKPILVRDHTGRLRAMETALRMEARIGQILGYDAAQKLDMHVDAGERAASDRLAREAAQRVAGGQDEERED